MVLEAAWFVAAASSSVPWTMIFLFGGLTGLAVLLLQQTRWLLHQLWWQPRRLERALRAQGVRGTSYKFPAGDLKEYVGLAKQAWTKPLPLRCHDTARRVTPFLHRLVQEHGKTSVSWFGPMPKVTISDPELAKDVLSNKSGHLEKLKFPALFKIMGHGVANHDGEKWAKHRKVLNPAFHLEKLKRMMPAFSACCQELVSRWAESLGSDGKWCELDIWPEMQNFTGDVISRTAFSSSYHQGTRIFQLQSEQAFLVMTNIQTVMIPGYMSLPTANNRKILRNNKEVESILRDIVGKRIQAMKQGESTKDDLLGLLLESNMRGTDGDSSRSTGMVMSIEDVIEECKLFYFAGAETTSVHLTWTMVVLSMHPEWQERAREEVTGLFGKNMPSYEGLSRLKIVTMVLYEALRLYPPVTSIARKTYKETEIGGITYPAGVLLEVPVLFIQHDPDLWGSDVHEFRPDRFAEGISKASKDDSSEFLAFGWGPRFCIGQNFALIEAKLALCMILQRFEFQLAPSYTHAPHTVITMHPMHGVQLKLRAI